MKKKSHNICRGSSRIVKERRKRDNTTNMEINKKYIGNEKSERRLENRFGVFNTQARGQTGLQ